MHVVIRRMILIVWIIQESVLRVTMEICVTLEKMVTPGARKTNDKSAMILLALL